MPTEQLPIGEVRLSNRMQDLACAVSQAIKASDEAAEQAAQHALDAGTLLCEAKEECGHGRWLPFLKQAGINDRRAQRLMKLARSGMKSDTVSELGGVTAALRYIALGDLPNSDTAIVWAWPSGAKLWSSPLAMITQSTRSRGFYHVHTAMPLDGGGYTGISTRKPVWGKTTSVGVNWLWWTVCHSLETSDIETRTTEDDVFVRLLRRREAENDGVWDDSLHELAIGLTSLKLWWEEEGAHAQ